MKKLNKKCDTPKCKVCGGRTALVFGYYSYSPDEEPYKNGVIEKSEVEEGVVDLSAYVCDKCGMVQNFTVE